MFAKFSAAPAVVRAGLLEKPPADPTRIQFRAAAEGTAATAVDAKAGRIGGVSLLTADREASGWGLWVDAVTLATFNDLLKGRRLKAYATHGSWGKDGTLDEVGYWEGARVDGAQLRADFQSLNAWRTHSAAEFEKLFELAEKLPAEFGASLAFRFRAVWVMKDGTEVETTRRWRYVEGEGYEQFWEPAMPEGALRDMPSVRATAVYSADFVDTPAANDGLFRAASVDARAKGDSPAQSATNSNPLAMLKQLQAKFGSNPALLARAIHFHTQDEKASFEQVVALVENEQNATELARLRAADTNAQAEFAKISAAGFKAGEGKSLIDVVLAEHAALKAKATAHDTAAAALKAAGFEDKDGKSATELALAAHTKAKADIATLRAGGSPAVDTGTPATDANKGGAAKLSGLNRVKAHFAAKAAGNN